MVAMRALQTLSASSTLVLLMHSTGAQLTIPGVTDPPTCDWADLPARIHALDAVCCFEPAANPGARCQAVECEVTCAAQLLPLLHNCHS